MQKDERQKTKISLNVWVDEYSEFKKVCHDERTTPTALINKLIREYGKKQSRDK